MLPQAHAATTILSPTSDPGDFAGTAGSVSAGASYSGGWVNNSGRPVSLTSNTATGRPVIASSQYVGSIDHRKQQRLDLGYSTTGTGEQYEISFYTFGQSASIDHGSDFGELTLYYTSNDTIGGSVVDSIVLQGFTSAGVWTETSVSGASFTIDPGAGKSLFLRFVKNSAGGDGNVNDENIGLDHISIIEGAVPEPSTALLGALSGLLLLRRRRR